MDLMAKLLEFTKEVNLMGRYLFVLSECISENKRTNPGGYRPSQLETTARAYFLRQPQHNNAFT